MSDIWKTMAYGHEGEIRLWNWPYQDTRALGKEILYNKTIGKHQELDLETFVDEFSSDLTSRSNEESSTSDNYSSIKIMWITFKDPRRRDSLDDLGIFHVEPLLVEESKLQ